MCVRSSEVEPFLPEIELAEEGERESEGYDSSTEG